MDDLKKSTLTAKYVWIQRVENEAAGISSAQVTMVMTEEMLPLIYRDVNIYNVILIKTAQICKIFKDI